MNIEKKNFIQAYYNRLYSKDFAEAVSECLTEDYVEHQYTTGFTKDGLLKYVDNRLHENPNHKVIIHHVICEGDMVFLMVEEQLANDQIVTRAELFRVEGDKIAEHWGGHVVDEKNRKNDNGTFDGARVNPDVDYASKYVKEFEELDVRGFDEQDIQCFYQSRVPEYIQHSPKGGDGLDGLVNILKKAKETGMKMIMQPKRTIIQGDFIVSHRFYDTKPAHPLINRINTFDLFRINAEGKAVEHWDVMEEVPSEDLLDRIF